MAERLTGEDGVLLFDLAPPASTTVTAPAGVAYREWEYNPRAETVRVTGGGDVVEREKPIRKRWRFTGSYVLDDLTTLVTLLDLINTEIGFGGKLKSTDTNPLVVGTGYLLDVSFQHRENDASLVRFEIGPSTNTMPTVDNTPGS